jgi:hypothetical protein
MAKVIPVRLSNHPPLVRLKSRHLDTMLTNHKKVYLFILLVIILSITFIFFLKPSKGYLSDINGNPVAVKNAWVKIDYSGDTLSHTLYGHGGGFVCIKSIITKVKENGQFTFPNPNWVSFGYFNHTLDITAYIENKGIFNERSEKDPTRIIIGTTKPLHPSNVYSLANPDYYCHHDISSIEKNNKDFFKTLAKEFNSLSIDKTKYRYDLNKVYKTLEDRLK